jgi:hypothetical protein
MTFIHDATNLKGDGITMGFRLNLGGQTPDAVEKEQYAPPGWYRVALCDVAENNDNGDLELEFEILDGNHKGLKIKERLKNPDFAEDEKKQKSAVDKGMKWAGRLGALGKDDFGRDGVEPDFMSCIGKEYVLELERREFTGKDGTKKQFTGPTYLGVYPVDHEKIPAKIRTELRLPPPRKAVAANSSGSNAAGSGTPPTAAGPQAGATPGGRPRVNVSDL